ncbi:MAG: cytochrome C [Pseudomonadota bacterium]|nr:cytochrome C [Pseudomonadota bacterium]
MLTLHRRRISQLIPICLFLGFAAPAAAVPSFARQTGMACAACHTVFPELTPFGREFKLNGYVIDNIKQITGISPDNRQTLALNSIPPLSVMLEVSYARTARALPDSVLSGALAKDGEVLFPQQASLFYAGKIAENLGAFMQLTYSGAGDHFGFDNTDIRYARHFSLGGEGNRSSRNLIIGITVNNNPTVQDVWNTTPAWGFPYAGSSTTPTPMISSRIDSGAGGIGQHAAGVGVYAWFDDSLYAEFSVYTAAVTGGAHPLDSTQSRVVHGISPYWRLAYERRWDRNSLEVGVYGIVAKQHPGNGTPLQGRTDRYTDTAADMQYQFIGENHLFTVLSTYINERQRLDASIVDLLAQNPGNSLKTFKFAAEYSYQRTIGGSLGYFNIKGTTDVLLYSQAPVVGSATNKPDSRGYIAEVNYLPWLNTKFQLQYVRYDKFNGSNENYDGAGRRAADNNTLYLLSWINF